jgi:two-component system alkaline phosphatase synthesis response regulator PhoP
MSKKILVIDDESGVVEAVQHILRESSYEVFTAYDGMEGLEKTKKEKPDLILLDIMMAGLDGFEVLRRLRRCPDVSSTPVIMLTARAETGYIFKALDLRATDYIIKPFDAKQLLKLIKRYLP